MTELNAGVREVFSTAIFGEHFYFGYYDVSPFNLGADKLLALQVGFIDRLPSASDVAALGYFDLNQHRWTQLGETNACNWQQGCRLQWLGPDFASRVIYNERTGSKFGAVVVDVATGDKLKLDFPIFSLTPDGKWSVTCSFERLYRLRPGYGYAGVADPHQNDRAPEQDGAYLLNIQTGEKRLILSLAALSRHKPIGSMRDGNHWIDLPTISPDGKRFCFLHRWELADGGIYTRLFSANLDGTNLHCLLDSGNFSHYAWRNEVEVFGWGRLPNAVSKLRASSWLTKNLLKPALPLYHAVVGRRQSLRKKVVRDSYLLFQDRTSQITPVASELLDEDGHCSWAADDRWLLTDTYPDKEQCRTLIIYDFVRNRRVNIGRFFSIPHNRYGLATGWNRSGMRCDLHPRWNRQGTHVCIDSVHQGSRQMYVFDVSALVKGED